MHYATWSEPFASLSNDIAFGVLTMNQVCNPAVGRYVSKIHSHEMLPWADWITKHLNDSVGPPRVKEEDLVQIKENLRY